MVRIGGNGLQLEKLRLNLSSCFTRLQKIDVNGRGLFSLRKLRFYIPLDVQRKCPEWIKLDTTNFGIVWTNNLRNPRDRAVTKPNEIAFNRSRNHSEDK